MEKIEYGFYKTANMIVIFVCQSVLSLIFFVKRKQAPPVDNKLLLKSVTTLAKEIREGKTKSKDVILAYIDRILEVEPYINATVDRCFESALKEAERADAIVASGEYTKEQLAKDMPLLGVPVTIKVIFTVKGLRCTGGCKLLKDQIATEDAPSVTLLKNAGAIVLATTNISEFGLGVETRNRAHGRTNNPYDLTRTSGGSSGGESALIAAGGSVFGIGNDLGGSVRIPSHFTGIYGHMPTWGTVPNGGCIPNADIVADALCTGPMSRYAEDLIISMKVLTSGHKIPMQFGLPVDFKKLKIRILTSHPNPFVYEVDKEIKEGIQRAVSYFKDSYGVEAKEIKIPLMVHATQCFFYNLLDKVNNVDDLKYELTSGKGSHINAKLDFLKLPFGLSTFCEGALLTFLFSKCPLVYKKRDVLFYKNMVKSLGNEFDYLLDENTVLFMPTYPTAAPHHYGTLPLIPSICYTSIFNLTGFPATQCHLGFNKQGLPYGMQVVGKKNNDPLTIACAIELEKALGGWVSPGKV